VLRGAGEAAHVVGSAGVLGLHEPDAAPGDGAGGAVDGDAVPRRGDRDLAGQRGEDGERVREGGPQRADQVTERREVVALVEEEALDRRQGVNMVSKSESLIVARSAPCGGGLEVPAGRTSVTLRARTRDPMVLVPREAVSQWCSSWSRVLEWFSTKGLIVRYCIK
jgi:hypothetical protein